MDDILPPFKKFSQPSDDDRKKAAIVTWAVRIGGGLLLVGLGVGVAKFMGSGSAPAAAAGNGLTIPHPSLIGNSAGAPMEAHAGPVSVPMQDSLTMLRKGADDDLYDPKKAAEAAAAAAAAQNAQASGQGDGQGQGAGNGADAGQSGPMGGDPGAGQLGAMGGAQGGAQGQGGGHFGGFNPSGSGAGSQTAAFAAGANYYNGGANGSYNGKSMNRMVAAPTAGHKVVGMSGGTQPTRAMGSGFRGLSNNSPSAFGTKGTGATTATTVATAPPPAPAPAPVTQSSGGNSTGGGAGVGGNPTGGGGGGPVASSGGGGPVSSGGGSGGETSSGGHGPTSNPPSDPGDHVGSCFTAGTTVGTPDGPRAIETIKAGELVYAVDPATFELAPRRVMQAHHHPAGPIWGLTLADGRTLNTTFEHRFYDARAHDWRAAGYLQPGDHVIEFESGAQAIGAMLPAPPARLLPDELSRVRMSEPGRAAAKVHEVEVVASRALDRREETYNLTVDEFSDYLADSVLVHNMKCTTCGQGGGGGCFTAGTPVMTPAGPRPIESIRPGDVVYSVDEVSRRLVPERVFAGPMGHPGENIYEMTLADGTTLRATSHHPFFDPKTGQYKGIAELREGDEVLSYDAASPLERIALPSAGSPALPRADIFAPFAPLLPPAAVPASWRLTRIVSLRRLPDAPTEVYNLLMEGPHHNFLAGGVLVHNPTTTHSF